MANSEKKTYLKFIWNDEEQTFCGRTGFRWLLICVGYLCLYISLAIFFIICLLVFYLTLRNTEPKWYGEESLTQGNPGLGLRPMPYYQTTLIRFQQGKPSSYKPYTDHLEAFLLPYEQSSNQAGQDVISCKNQATKPDAKACEVNLDDILPFTGCSKEQQDFGYEIGEPCILLKMNKIYGFVPEPYATLEELKRDNGIEDNENLRFLAFKGNETVGLSCEGENAADREHIEDGGINFHGIKGSPGFPAIFFPYKNQEGYRSPFVMVQFKKFSRRVVIQVVCKMYARNIDNSGTSRRHGTMRFELLKD